MNQELEIDLTTGMKLPLMEEFYTIQGEGFHTGKASYFIRVGGCDVGCHWCDVKESWDASLHPLTDIDSIIDNALKYACKTIVITGGEPSMYNLLPFTNKLKEKGFTVNIETSGAYPLKGQIDWICLSPKKTMPPLQEILRLAHELKVIVFNQNDLIWAESFVKSLDPNCILYLQPEWSKREKTMPLIIDYVMANPQWKISLQTHKYMNIP